MACNGTWNGVFLLQAGLSNRSTSLRVDVSTFARRTRYPSLSMLALRSNFLFSLTKLILEVGLIARTADGNLELCPHEREALPPSFRLISYSVPGQSSMICLEGSPSRLHQ